MSSSHQSDQQNKSMPAQRKKAEPIVCPECKKQTMQFMAGAYTLSDGTFYDNLERWQCYSCGTVLFDIQATEQVVNSSKLPAQQRALDRRPERSTKSSGKVSKARVIASRS